MFGGAMEGEQERARAQTNFLDDKYNTNYFYCFAGAVRRGERRENEERARAQTNFLYKTYKTNFSKLWGWS